jgi:hypothetical protein
MGHADDAMTRYYDVQDVERLRGLTSRILGAVTAAEQKARLEMEKAAREEQARDEGKLVEFRKAG